ncbi:MAG: HD domain-containing protein [Eubacteriales bacterium]|nr:HD domain-containing protein [Eubacteriales bacterium]MDD3074552.1 HD domain-containing protein [Eubacteriales bacterium]MDD4079064.1 HD domain-containing protein [Eubacteriales bacterium]MDD4768897.1 HD domain-containing protein [Eubacteriales bacterium]
MQQHYVTVANFVREYMQTTERPEMGRRRTASFRWRHTLRVLSTAREIGLTEGANMEVLEIAALLHDVAKLDPRSDEIHHAVLGSQIAEEFLHKLNIPEQQLGMIVEAIRFHSLDTNQDDLGLETLVLKDADRLDEVGALGIISVGIHAGRVGMDYRGCFRQGLKELNNLEDLIFYTASGKIIFKQRFKLTESFWRQAEMELAGESLASYADL